MNYEDSKIVKINLINEDEEKTDNKTIKKLFTSFVNEFTIGKDVNYFKTLHWNLTQHKNELKINLDHLSLFSPMLYSEFLRRPRATITIYEEALKEISQEETVRLLFSSSTGLTPLRNLNASQIHRLIKIAGIVISASKVEMSPLNLYLQCRTCGNSIVVESFIPRTCTNPSCPLDPFVIVPEASNVVDKQFLKVQETFDEVPPNEIPRACTVTLGSSLVNTTIPGERVEVLGILEISHERSFVHALSIERGRGAEADVQPHEMREIGRSHDAFELLVRSVAPGIYGMDDVKRAVTCLLLGGAQKMHEDGINVRGDLHLLLLGDPGLGKSQILKFVEQVMPVSVYTSGRGSSAAGLTASVLCDSRTGDFYLEGGALVLADGGVCCIDEFDKMDEHDRTSIHEAMEQQTLSIAKAGITTMLSTRTSVLAAANPAFGRFDHCRNFSDNFRSFSPSILSRFDFLFILKDSISHSNDSNISAFILNDTSKSTDSSESAKKPKNHLSLKTLSQYISYARENCPSPLFSADAKRKLTDYYVTIRNSYRQSRRSSAIRITVRQLEALIRISEAVAKTHLSPLISPEHVDTAISIFQSSTIHSLSMGDTVDGIYVPDFVSTLKATVSRIHKLMPIGASMPYSQALALVSPNDPFVFQKAIDLLVRQNKMISKDFSNVLIRVP